jgi:exopolyphosphatase
MGGRSSLRDFLRDRKQILADPSKHPDRILTFVVGNESADLDSICSSVIYAYIKTEAQNSSTTYIPLCNIPREDLALRPELIPVLKNVSLEPSELITLTDLPELAVGFDAGVRGLDVAKTRWLLVDHNALTGQLGRKCSDRIVGCIDHHEDEHKVPASCGSEPRIIEKAGSCSSLVVRYLMDDWIASQKLDGAAESIQAEAALARLALAPILIDTTNFRNKDKTRHVDLDTVGWLETIIRNSEHDNYNRTAYFQQLTDAKNAIDHLDFEDILRKDYKQWTENSGLTLGIGSCVKDLSFLVNKAGGQSQFWRGLRRFAQNDSRHLHLVSVMTAFQKDGQFCRELVLLALGEAAINAAEMFEADGTKLLGLDRIELGQDEHPEGEDCQARELRRAWIQRELGESRKQVAPLMREAMR